MYRNLTSIIGKNSICHAITVYVSITTHRSEVLAKVERFVFEPWVICC